MRTYIITFFVMFFTNYIMAQNITSHNDALAYKGLIELGGGPAYNVNTAQTVSSLNMQMCWAVSTSHGIKYKGIFGGLGLGYNHTQRDKENMYLYYGDFRYFFEKCKVIPSVGLKLGVIYDPYWIDKVQKYISLTGGVKVYDRFRVGVEGDVFSRPSRHFTANAMVVVCYTLGR